MNKVSVIDNRILYPVDAIYVILLVGSEFRKENVDSFLNDLNSCNEIRIVETVKKPWMKFFVDDKLKYSAYNSGSETYSALDCAMNHYTVIKSAYEKGLETIMICEDDANFECSIDEYISILNDIPEDADILQFIPDEICIDKFMKKKSWIDYKTYNIKMNLRHRTTRFSSIMYILNRNGMKYFIDRYDSGLIIADQPFFEYTSDLRYYVCNKPVMKPKYISNILDR